MPESTMYRPISVIDPLDDAFKKTGEILFKPFDFSKWFAIGFCAWLAYLGTQGGCNFSVNNPVSGFDSNPSCGMPIWVFLLVPGVFLLVIGLWLLVTWLSSRGKFMFLDCIAKNRNAVIKPWSGYKKHGNNLFKFRIVIHLIALACFLVIGFLIATVFFFIDKEALLMPFGLPILIILTLPAVCLVPVFAVFIMFTNDFVVPIMYLRNCSCSGAWEMLLSLIRGNKWRFTLYVLFKCMLKLAVGALIVSAGLRSCCTILFLISIPYIGTVALLPILTFFRSYSLIYLGQYSANLDVFYSMQGPELPEIYQ